MSSFSSAYSVLIVEMQAYGVHMNGYIEKDDQKYLWIGKRSEVKPTYPGMLDHLVAGGLVNTTFCTLHLIQEATALKVH